MPRQPTDRKHSRPAAGTNKDDDNHDASRKPYKRGSAPTANAAPSKVGSRKDARKQARAAKGQRKAQHFSGTPVPATVSSPVPKKRDPPKPKQQPAPAPQKQKKKDAVTKPAPSSKSKHNDDDDDDERRIAKLVARNPALAASMKANRVLPASAIATTGRDDTIDCMDIARYEKLLGIKKKKKTKSATASTGIPLQIASDGLGDLYSAVRGVTSKGEVELDVLGLANEDEDEAGRAPAIVEGDSSDDDDDEDDSQDDDSQQDSDMDVDDDDDEESDSDDEDAEEDAYLSKLGLANLEGMLGAGLETDDDDENSDGNGDDDNDDGWASEDDVDEEMDSDLEAEMREILARPEYNGELDQNSSDEDDDSDDE
ncbi:hypothetical protein BC828DRAFT_415999 [Blastocladiella britannica]|nr:hypothetical protein BC828DRAFT_415999 [Blastocladiella britannica]